MPNVDPVELAAQAYMVGFPLVVNLNQVQRYVASGVGANPAAGWNSFSHARSLATPADTFVTINNDTIYSMAQLDLSVGPVRLHVPDTGGRYYVLQFVDAWTNNFAYVGSRGTGTEEGDFLLVPPDWDAGAGGGETVIRLPTQVASIVGRWAVSGAQDIPAVRALQDATTLTQLNQTVLLAEGLRETQDGLSNALEFFEKMRLWSQQFPPAPRDQQELERFAPLGLTGANSVRALPSSLHDVLQAGFVQGKELLERILHSGSSPEVNGWQQTLHVFDFNLDYFEVGTVDKDQWKLTDPKVRVAERAVAALAGLWGNHGYEAAYLLTYVDSDGNQLDGRNTYRLRLRPTPPVKAFWSLTMYDVPDFFLISNPIDRYSIGDRTAGIIRDDDGGITITMGATEPDDPQQRANWLPAPAGPFRPVLRMYVPEASVFDGSYRVPAVERI